jgi:hypothetical protein
MIIKKIELSNFKSFKELKLELGKFNVMIGSELCRKIEPYLYFPLSSRYCAIGAGQRYLNARRSGILTQSELRQQRKIYVSEN